MCPKLQKKINELPKMISNQKLLISFIFLYIVNECIQIAFTKPFVLLGINPYFNRIKTLKPNTLIISTHDSFHTVMMLGDSIPVYHLVKQWYMETGIKYNIITSSHPLVKYLLKPISQAPFCNLIDSSPKTQQAIDRLLKKENVIILIEPKKLKKNTSCYHILSQTQSNAVILRMKIHLQKSKKDHFEMIDWNYPTDEKTFHDELCNMLYPEIYNSKDFKQ